MELLFRFEKARDLYRTYPEVLDEISVRPKGHSTREFIDTLIASKQPEEIIVFLAYLLARRQAIWWGHESLQQSALKLESADHRLSKLAVDWVGAPSEENAVRALRAAREVRPKSAAAWLALAAGWPSEDGGAFAHRAVAISVQMSLRSFPSRTRSVWLREITKTALRTQYSS